jgi:inhibitor of KinA sporulation pathway (predicted exonuclease)
LYDEGNFDAARQEFKKLLLVDPGAKGVNDLFDLPELESKLALIDKTSQSIERGMAQLKQQMKDVYQLKCK